MLLPIPIIGCQYEIETTPINDPRCLPTLLGSITIPKLHRADLQSSQDKQPNEDQPLRDRVPTSPSLTTQGGVSSVLFKQECGSISEELQPPPKIMIYCHTNPVYRESWASRIVTLVIYVLVIVAPESKSSINATESPRTEGQTPLKEHQVQLPKLQIGDSEMDYHRLHEAIHAAHIFAEIGAGYEASRVLGAIATQAPNNEAGEHARHVLREWGLTLSEIESMSAVKLADRIGLLRSDRRRLEITFIHVKNLVTMKLFREAAQVIRDARSFDAERNHKGGFHEFLEALNLSPESFESGRLAKESELLDHLKDNAMQRERRERIRFLRVFDPYASELAEAVNRHLDPGRRNRVENDERNHPLFRGEEDEQTQPPNLDDLLPELFERAERLEKADRSSALLLYELISEVAPNSRFAIRSTRRSDNLISSSKNGLSRSEKEGSDPGATVFGSLKIRHYHLELSEQSLERLAEEPKHYVRGTFYEGDQVYPNVGIRLKGGWGSFRTLEGENKAAFTIKFNQYEKKQRFHGLRRIVLNNAVQDPSYLRESIGYSLFRDAGIPAPRINYASVDLNGKSYGLYVQVEAVTKDFLKRWYDETNGNLYEGPGDVLDWRELDLDSNQDREDRSDLRRLATAIEEADDEDPWNTLSKYVDQEAFTRFIALEQIVTHWDGYTQTNNYRMYFNPSTSKFEFFPHGGDQLFDEPGISILREQGGILSRALLKTTSGKDYYLNVMRRLVDKTWDEQKLRTRVAEIYQLIRPHLAANSENAHRLEEFERRVERVLRFIKIRRYAILGQLHSEQENASWRDRRSHGHSFLFHERDEWE